MNRIFYLPIVAGLFLLAGCTTASPIYQGSRIDEVPMYGGTDRSAVPELKSADEKFISDVVAQFGSREKAGALWVEQGYKFYGQDRLGMAMRRFNQAWLLDPKNPEIFSGFAAILHDKGESCSAIEMMEKALALHPPTFQGIYPDAGRLATLCAVSGKIFSSEEKAKLLARSDELYKKSEEVEADKRYVFSSWATAYYWRGQYAEAWQMVAKARALGAGSGAIAGTPSRAVNQPSEHFLNALRQKMIEPAH